MVSRSKCLFMFLLQQQKEKAHWNFKDTYTSLSGLVQRKFFGFEKIKISDAEINIADKEKAIIDCLDREEYAGSIIEIFKALHNNKEQFDFDKMINYALIMENHSLARRLGFLLDLVKQDTKKLEESIGKFRYVYLSNTLPKKKYGISKKWRLILNIEENELFKW